MLFELTYGHYSDPDVVKCEAANYSEAVKILQDLADNYAEEQKWEYIGDYFSEDQEEEAFTEAMDQGTFKIIDLKTGAVFDNLRWPFD